MLRRLRLGATALVAAALAITQAGTAQALTYNYSVVGSNSGGANLRYTSSIYSPSLGYYRNGQRVWMICWKDSQWLVPPASDYSSGRWFYIEIDNIGHARGWMHSSLVENQRVAPAC